MITWRSFHQTTDISLLNQIETELGISFPEEYIEIASKFDSGVPDKMIFIAGNKERVFQRLISIRTDKHPNIKDARKWVDLSETLIPFALDPFGSMLCFDYSVGQFPVIVFHETETEQLFEVCHSFSEFLKELS